MKATVKPISIFLLISTKLILSAGTLADQHKS